MKYKCPYCGFYIFGDRPNGTYNICEVCFWEDDPKKEKKDIILRCLSNTLWEFYQNRNVLWIEKIRKWEMEECSMLKIGKFVFKDDWTHRRSSLMYFKGTEDETPSWSVDIGFAKGNYNGEEVVPSLCIDPIDTKKESITDLVGESFSVMKIDENYDREDSFYIYEHEPLADYKLKILEIDADKAHIKCRGTLVVDGYKEPPIKEKFEIDSWVPVIESVEDWDKFGL